MCKRIAQHEYDIKNKKETSALSHHAISCAHNIDFRGTKIIYKKKGLRERLFFEMVGIHATPNAINVRSDLDGLSSIYSDLLNFDYKREPHNGSFIEELSDVEF